ncbi:unnamed protein product [Vitrella brassicaformis CCMP3155]|uniref:Uncharacterized protein n=1 Tax=Vitrella brassicaformis (strain CCMP3155) TaxID=1169540 RepID=A0A0G4FID1_VITBC|nr:unnamed protein product [Vitrella brassicaformis CCMP3155]|eukprot:CEM13239.1 unnamed protein product [Vitrella brassicaformis CCMP3155]
MALFCLSVVIRLIESAAHFPPPHCPSPTSNAVQSACSSAHTDTYTLLPDNQYREAYCRGKKIEPLGTGGGGVGVLRWGKAKCMEERLEMARSRPSLFICGKYLYVFGGVIGDGNYKNDLGVKSLLSSGKYSWQECEVRGTPPYASDSLTLTSIHIPSPDTPTASSQPHLPHRYFACGGPLSSDNGTPREQMWGVLEISKEEKEQEGEGAGGAEGASESEREIEYRYQWVSKRELRGQENGVPKKQKTTLRLKRRRRYYFTSTFLPIRSTEHPEGYVFIFGGRADFLDPDDMRWANDVMPMSTIADAATWSLDGSDPVFGEGPDGRLNHTATLVKDRYVFIIGGLQEGARFEGLHRARYFDAGLDILDGNTKTWIEFDGLPWIAAGNRPAVDGGVGAYLEDVHMTDKRYEAVRPYPTLAGEFARHTAVLAGDKIVIMLPYGVNQNHDFCMYGGVKTVIFDTKTGRFSRPSFATQPQKMCATPPHPGLTPQSSTYEPRAAYEPPPGAFAAAVWTGSEAILYGGASFLDEDPFDDGSYDQSKYADISVLGVMDRKADDQIVPVDRHQEVAPFWRRYVCNRQLWQMDIFEDNARFDILLWDHHKLIEQKWYEERQAIAESKAKEREQLRERGVEAEIESAEGDEYEGMDGYTNKDIDDHLCGKPLPCSKVFGKPTRRTRHQALSKFFTVTGILRSDPMHWTLPKDDSQADATQTKITTFFSRRVVQSSLSGNHGYSGTKIKRSNRS